MKLLSKKKTKEQRLEASMAIKSISASVSLVANSRLGIVNYNPRNIRRDIWSNAVTTGAVGAGSSTRRVTLDVSVAIRGTVLRGWWL